MPQIIIALPNNGTPVTSHTLLDILAVLPDTVPFNYNFGISGRWLRDGQSSETSVTFLCDCQTEPSEELKTVFNSYLKPLGLTSTVTNGMQGNLKVARIYNNGALCVDRATGQYTSLPAAVAYPQVFTWAQFRALLPDTLPIPSNKWFPDTSPKAPDVDPLMQDIYAVGSLTLNLWTCHDIDLMVGTPEYDADNNLIGFVAFTDKVTLATIRNYFGSIMPLPVQVGQKFMLNREPPPINALKIYSGGKLCLQ